ncbi:Cullin-associated NEDD8-dissociated protein 1 [Labeo rohita]|uniref:Cullin-associated NEDD8-dissociated protein 1 n=2 Tax=Labeonini TaxID=2743697 RepID=A0ABQ8MRK3_LABRO|nr:Cullin-associated NEDD8-dissociated protein 1 [Labeo rohita]
MASASYHISNLLEKMTSSDKDFRFMATNDLMSELQKDSIKLDDDSERKVVKMILKLLEDKNGEFGPTCQQSEGVPDKEQLRDISSIGLKTVIGELPPASSGSALAASVCKKITGRLTSAIAKQEDVSVQLEALDIMADMLCSCLLPQLTSPRLAVRKRTIIALGHLVMSCGNLVFVDLIEHLLSELSRNESMSTTRTYIQCIAAISRQAGHRIGEYLEKIIPLVVKFCNYLTYDPNYNYDDEDEDENAMDADGVDEDYQGSDDEYSDDDDMSWKVRRAAAKCLDAVVSTRHEMLPEFYRTVSPALIARFKEREENVKADVFHAYLSLLKQTRPAQSWLCDPDAMEQGETPLTMLQSQVSMIVKALHKQMKEKSVKTRQCCFNMLTELVNVLPGALTQHIPVLIPGIIFSLNDKSSSSNLKIDALSCLYVILCNHQPQVFHPHVQAIVPPVVACVGDPFYKITSEALLVTQQLVKVIRPLDQTDAFDASPYIADLFACTIKRLKAADIDQEVKERAISCMGQIICNLGDSLGADLPGTLHIFLERLKNEITRLTTVKALTLIAGSPLKINLRPILGEAVPILASFLRKNQRALKLSTLAALDILVKNYSDSVTPAMIDAVLAELPPLINESDMHVSQMAISFLTTLARVHPDSLSKISGSILAELIALVRSPLLQGGALSAMLEFFQALVATGTASLGYMDLLRMLTGPVYAQSAALTHKQSYYSIAKCVAALTRACPKEGPAVVGQFIQDVKNSRSTDSIRLLALLSLGEVGHHVDLSGQPELKTVILDAFSSASEEVKSAASYALGSISVGNLPEYLPFVLQEISGQPKRQYLLLHSLKEIISSASVAGLKPYVENVWALLLKHCECTEEGTRNVVAECLGKLTLIDPETLLPRLKGYLLSGDFLKTLEDPDLNVRRVALVTFNSAAHNKPSLIRDLLDTVLPHLYNETKVRKDLIREVEMGPFKHTVDDGLDIRKAAFECMYTLLDSCLDRLDIFEFLNHVEDGLKDHYDIKMLTFLMLARLSSLCPSAVLQRLDRLVEPLRATCTTKVKANSVKQEFEKQDELKRSAMRAVVALLTIPEAEKSPLMSEFQSQISSNPELAAIFDSIQRDSSSANMESMDTIMYALRSTSTELYLETAALLSEFIGQNNLQYEADCSASLAVLQHRQIVVNENQDGLFWQRLSYGWEWRLDVIASLPCLPGVKGPLRDEEDDDDVRSHKSLPAVMTGLTLQPRDKRCSLNLKGTGCKTVPKLPPISKSRNTWKEIGPPRPPCRSGCRYCHFFFLRKLAYSRRHMGKYFSAFLIYLRLCGEREREQSSALRTEREGMPDKLEFGSAKPVHALMHPKIVPVGQTSLSVKVHSVQGNGPCLLPAKASGVSPRSRLTFQSPVVQAVYPISPDTMQQMRQTDRACQPLRSVLKKGPNRGVFNCPLAAHLLEPFSGFQEHLCRQILHSPLPYRAALPQLHIACPQDQVKLLPAHRGPYGSLMERTVELCNSQGQKLPKITMTCPTPSPKYLCRTEFRHAA